MHSRLLTPVDYEQDVDLGDGLTMKLSPKWTYSRLGFCTYSQQQNFYFIFG